MRLRLVIDYVEIITRVLTRWGHDSKRETKCSQRSTQRHTNKDTVYLESFIGIPWTNETVKFAARLSELILAQAGILHLFMIGSMAILNH